MLIATWMLALAAATEARAAQTPPSYRIVLSAETPRIVRVEAEFTVREPTLRMYGYGADHLPDGWRTFVRNERVVSAAGREVELERLPERKWRLAAEPGERVRLTYDVAIEHDLGRFVPDAREGAYVRDWGVFAVGRALFIYNDPEARSIEVAFDLPEGFKVETAWPRLAEATFRAESWNEAINSIVFAGRFASFEVVEGAVTVAYAVGGPGFDASRELLSTVTRDLLRSFGELFGGAPAARLFVVINPDPAVLGGGGGVFGRSISMTFGAPPSRDTIYAWGHTLAHEFFHIWNATALRRGGESEEWLVEGNADYYAVLTMTRLGYFPVPVLLGKLGGAMALYDRVAGRISLVQAGHQEWQPPGPAMLYNGGWVAAFTLDLAVRRATADRKSLDDVMRDLYSRLGNTGRPLTNDELLAALRRSSGTDFTDFFRRYIDGTARAPALEYLPHIGLEPGASGELRLDAAALPEQVRSRAAYLGPRATYEGKAPAWALRGHDPDLAGGRFEPAGRYELVLRRAEGDVPLVVAIAEAGGKLTAIVSGPGGTILADEVAVSGTHIALGFTAHDTPIRVELDVRLDGVSGTWRIEDATGNVEGKRLR